MYYKKIYVFVSKNVAHKSVATCYMKIFFFQGEGDYNYLYTYYMNM